MTTFEDRYRGWTGDFLALVHEARMILRSAGHADPDVSDSGLRYYQKLGIIGRGNRVGKTSQFGMRELLEVLAAKILQTAGTMSLSNIAEVVPRMTVGELLSVIEGLKMPPDSADPASPPSSRPDALAVVNALRSKSGLNSPPAMHASAVQSFSAQTLPGIVAGLTPQSSDNRVLRNFGIPGSPVERWNSPAGAGSDKSFSLPTSGYARPGAKEVPPGMTEDPSASPLVPQYGSRTQNTRSNAGIVRRVTEINSAPWLRVIVDDDALRAVSDAEVDATSARLLDTLKQLRNAR